MTKFFKYSLTKDLVVFAVILSLFLLMSGWVAYQVLADTTTVDVTMSAGTLALTSSGTATLAGQTVSTSSQTSTGSIANVSITDTRGSGAGWSAVMTSKNFTRRDTHKVIADADSDAFTGFTGTYDGLDGVIDPVGTFEVEVTTGGAISTAVFKWTDPAGNETTGVTTAATNVLSNGITVDWDDSATYDIGDIYAAAVDVFPYTVLTVTPQTTVAASGSLTGITDGSAGTLTGSAVDSDSFTLVTAAVNTGFGDYDQQENLSLTIHANSLDGQFTADATITVS